MPIYEYVCQTDGDRIELLRPMSQADAPVKDPAGKGRKFGRILSVFAAQGTATGVSTGGEGGGRHVHGGSCGCGKPAGGCSRP